MAYEQNFGFYNFAAMVISLALIALFLVFLSANLRSLKNIAFKIKLILKAAFEAKSPLLAYEADVRNINCTQLRLEMQRHMRRLTAAARNATFRASFFATLEKYDHLIAWPCTKDQRFNVLRPTARFYHFLNLCGVFVLWLILVFLAAILHSRDDAADSPTISSVAMLAIACCLIASPSTMLVTHFVHRTYLQNVRSAFKNAFLPQTHAPPDFEVIEIPEEEAHLIRQQREFELIEETEEVEEIDDESAGDELK